MRRALLLATLLTPALLALWAAPGLAQRSTLPTGIFRLFSTGNVSGNGADLTEDPLSTCSYTMPAGMLANVGDTIHIRAAGAYAATTDSKTTRVRVGGVGGVSIASIANAASASATAWAIDTYMVKTGPSAQSIGEIGVATSVGSSPRGVTSTITDTVAQQIVVTGQNTTTAVASSITCQIMTVNFEH